MDATPPTTPPPSGLRLVETRSDLRKQSTVDENGCWIWRNKPRPNGYGRLVIAGKYWYAHRYAFTICKGTIPEDMTVDHICWVRNCVNPDHLRLLTLSENASRQRSKFDTHCPSGKHLKTPENTTARPRGGKKRVGCLDCRREAKRNAYKPSPRKLLTPEERLANKRQSARDTYWKNREKTLEKAKERYQKNREEISAKGKARYQAQKNAGLR